MLINLKQGKIARPWANQGGIEPDTHCSSLTQLSEWQRNYFEVESGLVQLSHASPCTILFVKSKAIIYYVIKVLEIRSSAKAKYHQPVPIK